MGRPSGDCNCYCGSGTGGGGGGGGGGGFPSPPTGITDPGCDTLCAYGFLYAIYAPMSNPQGLDPYDNETIKYYHVLNSGISNFSDPQTEINVSHSISGFLDIYPYSIGSGNKFILMSPYLSGTADHNNFASGTHIILNSSGVPFGDFTNCPDHNKLICQSGTYPIIGVKHFNSYSVIENSILRNRPVFEIGTHNTLNDVNWIRHYSNQGFTNWQQWLEWYYLQYPCNYNYYYSWWWEQENNWPFTANFRKLSLQYHNTSTNTFYWIPFVETQFSYCYPGYWYDFYYYNSWDFSWGAYGSFDYRPFYIYYNGAEFQLVNYYYNTNIPIVQSEGFIGWNPDEDPEQNPCYYYQGWSVYPTGDLSFYLASNQYISINLSSYIYSQGGRKYLNYGSYFGWQANIPSDQVATLASLGLTFCPLNGGYIFGQTTFDPCVYIPAFTIDVSFTSYCCGDDNSPISIWINPLTYQYEEECS